MFIVLEIQRTNTISAIPTAFGSRDSAEEKYHDVLRTAAVSSVPVHSCVLLDDAGYRIKRETYYHDEERS